MFYALVAGSVFIFRRRLPDAPRPYRTLGYPVVPILFLIVTTWLILTTIWNTPLQSSIGVALILLGLPVYLYWEKHNRKNPRNPTQVPDGEPVPESE